MSVTSLQSLFQYAIASLGQAFTPACPIQNTSDFVLTYTNALTFIDTALTLNVDYFVTGVSTNGVILAPTVTLEGTGLHYAVGGTLTLQRKNPFTQPTTYVDGVKYLAAVPNNSLDWLCYSVQSLNDLISRCLQITATGPSIPPMARTVRASKFVTFDAAGNLSLIPATANPSNITNALVLADLSLTQRRLGARFGEVFNVKDYGAMGDGVTDDYAAIMAAYNAIPVLYGGTLYFPPGRYAFGTALSFTNAKPLQILGAGQMSTILSPNFAAGNALTVNGPLLCGISNLGFIPTIGRTQGTFILYVFNCARPMLSDLYFNNLAGGLVKVEAANFLQMVNCQGDSAVGSQGDTCLRIKGAGGTVSNCYFRTGTTNTLTALSPCLWLTGNTTSLKFNNCGFSGGGPKSKFNISNIASTGANFTVTVVAHDFNAGDHLVIRGASVAAYNTAWFITSVTATTIVVGSTLNPGAAIAQGTVESVAACALVTNEDGYVNESSMDSILFENISTRIYGTASLYFDGRRGTVGARSPIEGWNLDSLYFDYGADGLVFASTEATAASGDTTVFGFDCSNLVTNSLIRAVLIWQAHNIVINGLATTRSLNLETTDYLTGQAASAGVYIYTGLAAPFARGITIENSNIGHPRSFYDPEYGINGYNFRYGFIIDGAGLQDFIVAGSNIYGFSLPFEPVNGAVVPGQRWKIKGNQCSSGATPLAANTVILSVASGINVDSSIGFDVVKVTGTTNVTNILSGWLGKEVDLLFVGALTLNSGGNLAIAAGYAVLAGQVVRVVFDGTSWFVK